MTVLAILAGGAVLSVRANNLAEVEGSAIGEIENKCSRKRSEVLIETDTGDIKEEKYEVLILDALKYMLDNRVFAKKNMKKKKEKG